MRTFRLSIIHMQKCYLKLVRWTIIVIIRFYVIALMLRVLRYELDVMFNSVLNNSLFKIIQYKS